MNIRFLSTSSEKAVVSGIATGFLNAIQYLAPADRALQSFCKEFGFEAFEKLHKVLVKASAENPAWKRFAMVNTQALAAFRDQMKTAMTWKGAEPVPQCPKPKNHLWSGSLCPWASPGCYSACLNSSGHGGVYSGKLASNIEKEARKSGIAHGVTSDDDMMLFYLAGVKFPHYGGAKNDVKGMRIARTHAMWLAWIEAGSAMQSSYSDALFDEVKLYVAIAKERGIDYPIAVRFNGTSDLPYHTMRLTSGENLMTEIGKLGIVCYDYTKDDARMEAWLAAKSWKGYGKKVSYGRVVKGFPDNYYLTFSWCETNPHASVRVLQKGGNVTMVFVRPENVKAGAGQLKFTSRDKVGSLPREVDLSTLALDKGPKRICNVVNGGITDIRFLDPYRPGVKNGGSIIGLEPRVSKVSSLKAELYTVEERRRAYRFFHQAIVEKGRALFVNPAPSNAEVGAVSDIDMDLLAASSVRYGKWAIAPTSMAT